MGVCAGSTLLSGCSFSDSTVPGVAQIAISVQADRELAVELTVEKNGEVVHNEYYDESTDRIDLANESWMGETVNYELTVSLSNGREEVVTTEELGEQFDLSEEDCFGVNFHISNDGGIDTYVTDSYRVPSQDSFCRNRREATE